MLGSYVRCEVDQDRKLSRYGFLLFIFGAYLTEHTAYLLEQIRRKCEEQRIQITPGSSAGNLEPKQE